MEVLRVQREMREKMLTEKEPTRGLIKQLQKKYQNPWTRQILIEESPPYEIKKVYKYKRINQKIRPIPSHIPNHLKVK
jgi:hypothetical protein